MDGQTLQQLFSGSNPFLAQMGEKAFNLDQQKRQADLATTLGMEQRNQAMHPLEMASKQASTKLNESTAGLNQYALDTKLPKDKALEQVMQKFHKETDDVSREQAKAKVIRMMQIARMAKAAGGVLPEGMNLTPEEMRQLSPDRLDPAIQYGETFLRYDPTEIAARQRAAEAQSLANIRTEGQIAVKTTPGAGGGGKPTPPAPGSNEAITADLAKFKEARQALQRLKIWYPQMTPEQKQQWLPVIASLKKQAENEPLLPGQGKVDPVATANDPAGGVSARPAIDLGGAPGAVANRPQRQQPAVNPKDITPANIAFTAKELGISEEEVKKRLGIK